MANHCQNFAYFSGEPEQISKLEEALKRETANHLKEEYTDKGLAIPKYASNTVELYARNYNLILSDQPDDFTKPGYDVYDLYGSKWFECEWEVMCDTEIQLTGSSAWSPVIAFFEKICTTYQLDAYGDYAESGMDFAGEFTITKEGEVTDDQTSYQQYEANNNPDSFFENVLYYISDGNFESFQSVLDHFKDVSWDLTDVETETLKKEYHEYLMTLTDK
jgi:hypothetical protein